MMLQCKKESSTEVHTQHSSDLVAVATVGILVRDMICSAICTSTFSKLYQYIQWHVEECSLRVEVG
jgi:hypothetical protein